MSKTGVKSLHFVGANYQETTGGLFYTCLYMLYLKLANLTAGTSFSFGQSIIVKVSQEMKNKST